MPSIMSHIVRIRKLEAPLGVMSFIAAGVGFAGYPLGVESLFRPISGTPAANPLTLLGLLLLSAAHIFNGQRYRLFRWFFIVAGAAGAALRLAEFLFDADIASSVTPFESDVAVDILRNGANAMAANSAVMLLLCALSHGAQELKFPNLAQLWGFGALSLPMTTLVGYSYGIHTFHGKMAIITMIAGLLLCASALTATAHRGGLRAILIQSTTGGIIRFQLALAAFFPFLVGNLFVHVVSVDQVTETGIFVILMTWFVVTLIGTSALALEKTDRGRRMMERQLLRAATIDSLTQLPNRRHFFETCRQEWLRSLRSREGTVVLMVDVDHFKRLNDTRGHAFGDEALRKIGLAIKSSVRVTDMPARIGGEEFAVMLPNTSLQGGRVLAEQLRKNIFALTFGNGHDNSGVVSVSIGCAASSGKNSFEHQLACADAALFKAKEQGRNRVVCETPGENVVVAKSPQPSGKPQMN